MLGAGDEITVAVWRNDDLGRTLRIDPEGNANLPLVGEVRAADLTPSALAQEIARRLADKYLVNPQVTINVGDLQNRKVFVMGEVSSPGVFSLNPRMSVLEAVASAGGFLPGANRKKVLLIRQDGGSNVVSGVNLKGSLKMGKKTERVFLKERDVVFVPPSVVGNVERFLTRMGNMVYPILGLESSIVVGRDALDVLGGSSSAKDIVVTQ
ncbi:MAG: polysaccharide biosynthesis/export family protein [Lentisphaerae bacterium]|nr:polysaccharide biosynthesis/export family protein [Lentisphaerota bacterium]